jgi:DNA-binding IclR family transcriptional regulator
MTLDREEFFDGLASVAAPVFDRDGECIATVIIVYPAIQASRQDGLVPLVTETADRIAMSLGYVPGRREDTGTNQPAS